MYPSDLVLRVFMADGLDDEALVISDTSFPFWVMESM